MTTRGRIGVMRVFPAAQNTPGIEQQATDRGAAKVDTMPLRDHALVTGIYDPVTKNTSDGVTFTAGQTLEVAHTLGRRVTGFIVANAELSAPELTRDDANLTVGLETTHTRLTHNGGSDTRVKLLVF